MNPGMSVEQAAFVVGCVFVLAWLTVCLVSALRGKPPMARRRRRRNTVLKPIRIPRAPDPVCERRHFNEFTGARKS